MSDNTTIGEKTISTIFALIGDDGAREGLKDTPRRVVKMWNEIFRGYDENQKPKVTVFDNNADGIQYDQMITDTGHGFSMCEHHMMPFEFSYTFAYIPAQKVIGLSKVARIVDFYAAKLQVQERLTKEILDELEDKLKPKGIALMLQGRHLCKSMRGAKKEGSMRTTDLRGAFKFESDTRMEFMNITNN